MNIYDLLQELIDYPNRCVIVILCIQFFFNLAVVPMLILDIKNKTPDSILSMISYCTSFGINLLLTFQVITIIDDADAIIRLIALIVSFGLFTMINTWLMVALGYKERRK